MNGEVRDLPVDKPASLLYYLASRADWVGRSELAYLYRPDAPEEVALGNVRVLLHRAKTLVEGVLAPEHSPAPERSAGTERSPAPPLELGFEVEKTRVRFLVETDVAEFRRLARAASTSALSLYRGPFLSGVSVRESPGYDTWLELERSNLSQQWRHLALAECTRLQRSGAVEAAADLTSTLVTADPLDEEALQAHLRALFAAGRRSEARSAYENLVKTLGSELGVDPLESTTALFSALDAGHDDGASVELGAGTHLDPGAQRHNLPQQSTRFVGRQREFDAVVDLLARDGTRLVTITGLGGVGKSRLALEVAARRLADHEDGVWFVELAGTGTPELVPTAIATALRLDVKGGRGATAALTDHLRTKRVLLVLDNFEHLVEAAAGLHDLLEAAPGLALLVTSRVPLDLRAESIFELEGLATPPAGATTDLLGFDAVRLFVDRAERLSEGFVASGVTLEAVAEVTRRVEGMPLALELAATWTRSLSAPELVRELDGSLELLSASLRDLPERHRSIRTVIAYSWGLLTDVERRALAGLSTFRGSFTQQAAEQVAGVHLALLVGLVSHSLVTRKPGGRFHLHELVRLFASEHADQSLVEPHSRYYLRLLTDRSARLRTPERAAVLEELLDDLDNIRLAFETAIARFDAELLAAALPDVFWLSAEAGSLEAVTRRLHELEAEARRRDHTHGRLWLEIRLQLVRALMSRGDFGAVRAPLEELVAELRAPDSDHPPHLLVRALDWAGSSARITGDLAAAEALIGEALALAERGDDTLLLADVTYNRASLAQTRGQHDAALQHHGRSLELCLSAGDDVGAAMRRLALANVLFVTGGDRETIRTHLESALATARAARVPRLEGATLNALAVLAGAEGNDAAAERYNLEALALARHTGQRADQRTALANLGGMLNKQERLDEAAVYLRQALALAQDTDGGTGLNQVYALLGANASRAGDHAGAAAYFVCSLDKVIFDKVPAFGQTQCLSLVAYAHERAGRLDAATALRRVLVEHPATPPHVRKTIADELVESGVGGDEPAKTDDDATSLVEVAAAQREILAG